MEITQIFGVSGAIIYLVSYILLQTGWIKGEGNLYAGLNMLAAVFVLISLTTKFNIGSFLIQVSFISLSLYAILRSFLSRRPVQISPAEQQLADTILPGLPYRRALKLIRNGVWKTEEDAILASQGEPLNQVSVLINGNAVVRKNGQRIAEVKSGQIIGEITCLEAKPATAEVSLAGSARYFAIPSNALRDILFKNQDILSAFELGQKKQMALKLA